MSNNRSQTKPNSQHREDSSLLPENMRTGLYRYQKSSLFSPALAGQTVTHHRVKLRNLKDYARGDRRILQPVCMDRTKGNSLFSPANLGKILAMLENKLIDKQLDITILLTDEIYAFSLQRAALNKDINKPLTLEEAKVMACKFSDEYKKEIEPYINEFVKSKAGHKIRVKYLSEYASLEIPAKLYLYYTDKYESDRNFRRIIDKALSKFYMRQLEQGETLTYDEAKPFNLKYLLTELATLIYIYGCCRDEIDHHLYECDDLSPELTEAAICVAKDFFQRECGVTINHMDEFFLEFKFHEFDSVDAKTKQHMEAEYALLDKIKDKNDPESHERKAYLERCKSSFIVLSGDLGIGLWTNNGARCPARLQS